MGLSLDVKPELQDRVREEAQRLNLDPAVLLSEAIIKGLSGLVSGTLPSAASAVASPGQTERTRTQEERTRKNARLIALLDSFEEGDAEQQRRDLEALQEGLEEARPGQRRLFGEGVNP